MGRFVSAITPWFLMLACSSASLGPSRAASLGGACLDLQVPQWPEARQDSLAFLPPPRVRLHESAISSDPQYSVLTEVPGSLPGIHRIAMWRVLSADTLELGWSTGFDGVMMRLRIASDTLTGRAESFHDVGDGMHASAEAVRVACDAPLPPAMRRRHGPTVVPLHTEGAFIAIGGRVDPRWGAHLVESGEYRLSVSVTGVFAGADSTHVDLDSRDQIAIIRLSYRNAETFSRVVEDLVRTLGAPSGGGFLRNRDLTAWVDRERWIVTDATRQQVTLADPKRAW